MEARRQHHPRGNRHHHHHHHHHHRPAAGDQGAGVRLQKGGLSPEALRELSILSTITHPNIVAVVAIATGGGGGGGGGGASSLSPASSSSALSATATALPTALPGSAVTVGALEGALAASDAANAAAVVSPYPRWFLVMESVEHTLSLLMAGAAETEPLSEGQVRGLLRQLLSALAALHSKGIGTET